MRNEAWFYSGVRYAKDGRYCCFCPTPASKRTVLLAGATVTLDMTKTSIQEQITPFNVDTKELIVEYPIDNSQQAQAFTDSNYFIFHALDTGMYYFYFVDYIEPYQQFNDNDNPNNDQLVSYPNNVVFRVGITLDYWQTYFFKTRTKFTAAGSKPVQGGLHVASTANFTEVVMPAYDFANIERTNIRNIINVIGNDSERFKPLKVDNYNMFVGEEARIPILGNYAGGRGYTAGRRQFGVLLKLNFADKKYYPNGGIYWGYWKDTAYTNIFNDDDLNNLVNMLNQICISTGTNITEIGGYNPIPANTPYSLEAAYIVPDDIMQKVAVNFFWTDNATLKPTNGLSFTGVNFLRPARETGASTPNNNSYAVQFREVMYETTFYSQLIVTLQHIYPNWTENDIRAALPYITIGTKNNRLPAVRSINDIKQHGEYVAPLYSNKSGTVPLFWLELRKGFYGIQFVLSNGTQEIDITEDFSLPLRNVTDGEEIDRQKRNYELSRITQGINLLSSGVGLAGSVVSGNAIGGVLSASQIAAQSLQLENAVSNPPNFDKQLRSQSLSKTALESLNYIWFVSIFIPRKFPSTFDGTSATVINATTKQYESTFTEIGIEIGETIRPDGAGFNSLNLMLNAASYQNTGFIQMGCVLLYMPQEAGEILERRLREGVSFWYV